MTQAIGGTVLLSAAFFALLLLGPKRGGKLPWSERACLALFRLAGWIERTATAWDAAILRYRMEKATSYIEMESTRHRESQEVA